MLAWKDNSLVGIKISVRIWWWFNCSSTTLLRPSCSASASWTLILPELSGVVHFSQSATIGSRPSDNLTRLQRGFIYTQSSLGEEISCIHSSRFSSNTYQALVKGKRAILSICWVISPAFLSSSPSVMSSDLTNPEWANPKTLKMSFIVNNHFLI